MLKSKTGLIKFSSFEKVVLAKPVISEEHVKIVPANRIHVKIAEFAPSMKQKLQNFHANVLKAFMEIPVIQSWDPKQTYIL